MAKWNDLPLELKEHIVDMVDDMGCVRSGLRYASGDARATLCALSLVSREAWQLAARVLWQTLDMDRMSAEQLQSWRTMSARVAPFVRSTKWTTGWIKTAAELALPATLSTFLEIAPTLPGLTALDIPAEGRWPEVASALPLSMREQIKELKVCRGGNAGGAQGGSSLDAAALVQGFPLVSTLHLALFHDEDSDDGGPTLIAAIQSLRHLETFSSWNCSTLDHSSLRNKWQGPVASYDSWSIRMPITRIRRLMITFGDTLKVFKAGLTASSKAVDPLPLLPLLHTAEFALEPAMSSTLSTLLSTLRLRNLDLMYGFDEPDEQLKFESIAPFLQAGAATLESLSISFEFHMGSAELFSDGDREKLNALAEEKGVALWVAQISHSDEEDED